MNELVLHQKLTDHRRDQFLTDYLEAADYLEA